MTAAPDALSRATSYAALPTRIGRAAYHPLLFLLLIVALVMFVV
jgi:hypothetical protein